MRKIKFKVEIDGNWVALTLNEMLEYAEQGNDIIKNCKKLQYTGLKDIDGAEIYEGDIVQIVEYESRYDGKFDEFRSEVIFINGYFGYMQYEEHLGHKTDYYLSSVCTEDGIDHKGSHFCNVVGNIYETPISLNH